MSSVRDKVRAEVFKKTAGVKEMTEEGTTATKERSIDSISEKQMPLQILEESIKEVDLVRTLQNDLSDPLVKYQNEEGTIDKYKIPQNLYIVAIIHEVIKASKKIDLGICVRHGVIYIFTGNHWQETEDEEVKRILSRVSIKLGYYSPAGAVTSDFKKKLFMQFMDTGIDEASTSNTNSKILINLKNGTLEIDKHNVKLRDHNRDDFLTYVLNYNYDVNAVAPIFSKFMDEVLPDKNTQYVLQEFLGYVFSTNLKLEKVAVLYGSGANGKSVFFEVITMMMGKDNLSFKGLGDICMKGDKGNNHRAELESKLINYASELNPQGADIEIFKALVSGEPVSARRLYKDVYTFSNNAKLIFNANKLPTETERTHGFFRRFLIIPFDITIPDSKKDIHLHNKIIDSELSGVLNWAIDGLRRLLSNEDFTYSDAVEEAVEKYKKETNSVALFVEEEGIVAHEDGTFPNKMLYDLYKTWVIDAGMGKFSNVNFGKEMKSLGFETYKRGSQRGFKVMKGSLK